MKLFCDKADLRDIDTAAVLLAQYLFDGYGLMRGLRDDLKANESFSDAIKDKLSELEVLLLQLEDDARTVSPGLTPCYANDHYELPVVRDRLRKAAAAEALKALESQHLWSLVSGERWLNLPVNVGDEEFPF